jgi:hypothetical protein
MKLTPEQKKYVLWALMAMEGFCETKGAINKKNMDSFVKELRRAQKESK